MADGVSAKDLVSGPKQSGNSGLLDWDNPFKPEDFEAVRRFSVKSNGDDSITIMLPVMEEVARLANARFREIVAQGKRVWGKNLLNNSHDYMDKPNAEDLKERTHTAILICEKELEK